LCLGWSNDPGIRVLARLQAEGRVVDGAKLEEEEQQEDGAGNAIEDSVPDHLGRGSNDVASFGQGPADRVCQEHESEERRGHKVSSTEGTAGSESRAWTVPEEDIPDVEKRGRAEGEEAPLVGTLHQRTDETTYHQEDSHEQGGKDIREGESSGQEDRQKQKREGNEPLDVSYIPYLTRLAVSTELGNNRCGTEIRGHREVCKTGSSEDNDRDLVEEPSSARAHEVQDNCAKKCEGDEGKSSP